MNFANTVFEISKSFMTDSSYVQINGDRLKDFSEQMKEDEPPSFPIPEVEDIQKGILLEIVAASVNYCYWYGKSTIRPLQANSTKMYNLLLDSFNDYQPSYKSENFKDCINKFIIKLSQQRFPLIEERVKHLEELVKEDAELFSLGILNAHERNNLDMNKIMTQMISMYPGFASDLFLKRLSLFFIQLFRRFGWFEKDLHDFFVPADYQVPKMLEYFECISYDYSLQKAIENGDLIPKGSSAECEIRAATVLTIKRLCELTGWNVAEVDGYFFLQRNSATNPFHITITTDY